MTLTTCGLDHAVDCLCDVHIESITPINFGTNELWHGEAVTRAMNLGVPWSSKDFADLMGALTKAHDTWVEGKHFNNTEAHVLRVQIIDLLRAGDSIIDVADILGCAFKQVLSALTNDTPATVWMWDEAQWLAAEALIYDGFEHHSAEVLVEMLGGGFHRGVIDQIADWYGVTVNLNGQARLTQMQDALRGGMHPLDAVVHFTALGFKCSPNQMYMMRKRLSERGEVSSALPSRSKPPTLVV